MDVIVPRWIKRSPYLTYGSADVNNKIQAKEIDAYNPVSVSVFVTSDNSNKIDGYPVLNPITNQHYFMSGINASDTAFIYKRSAFGQMFLLNQVVKPTSISLQTPSLNQSHEPLLINGILFSAFQINNYGGSFFNTTLNQPGEIWMTSIDQGINQNWLLSSFDPFLNVSEPETYVGSSKAWVYYSAVPIQPGTPLLKRQFQLRRCDTPLTLLSDKNEQQESFYAVLFPNPANEYLNISYADSDSDVLIRIFNFTGDIVLETINKTNIYIGNWSKGVYLVKLMTKKGEISQKVVKID